MDVVVALFGQSVVVLSADTSGCVVGIAGGRTLRFDTTADGRAREGLPTTTSGGNEPAVPFTFREFGETRRLTWANGGGCSVRARARVVYWGERWAAVVETSSITVIDGVQDRQVRLEVGFYVLGKGCAAGGGRLWIGGDNCVRMFETAALEALLDTTVRKLDAVQRRIYPLRHQEAAIEAKVVWMLHDEDALVNVRTSQMHIHGKYGLEKGMQLVMRDECWPGRFASAEVENGLRIPLFEPELDQPFQITVVRSRSKDPAAHTPAITATDPRLEPLLAAVASDPDNEANRLVLVDLLQELGASFGAWVAEGKGRAQRHEALGPLAHYLDDVEYRGDLPWSATLVRRPPLDEDIIAQAVDDLRLGMLSELRVGKGPRALYARFVGSPRTVGLRRVDVNEREIAQALIDAGRTQLTHLYDVRFTKAPLLKLLAHETFDRVVEIDTIVQRQHLAGLLARVEADQHGMFARAPRTLVMRETYRHDVALVEPALRRFPTLPLAGIVIGDVRVRRHERGIEVDAPPEQLEIARRALDA